MVNNLTQLLPPEGVKILLVLFLSFLVGLEREEHKGGREGYGFGGVRTFPLIGLVGYASSLLSGQDLILVVAGFVVVAAFLLVSYRHKLEALSLAGATSEISGLTTYLIGALVFYDHFWIATTLAVASLLLLELKIALETLAQRAAPGEILTFAKFLLLTVVILPVLPDTPLGPFHLNPFRTWLVVAAVSAVSYGSYVIQRATRGRGGVVLAAILGGAYSSTVTTVVLAKRSREAQRPALFAGGMLVASGMMYLRLIVLLALFNVALAQRLGPPFAVLAALAIVAGLVLSRLPDRGDGAAEREWVSKNPLELGVALLFAVVFVVMLVATQLAAAYLGKAGIYGLAALMGVADVDPFIMGLTQSAGTNTALPVAASAILITVASNNVVKGIYAFAWADRHTGRIGLGALVALALCSLVPLVVPF
jgi:uncharacterized membrane protein (DUF4010 family)